MDNGWEVVFGFAGGGHEVTAVKDEARALAIANVIIGKAGGPAAWINLHPDADGQRIAVCYGGKGPLHSIRLRKSPNGDAAASLTDPEPTPAPAPEPEKPTTSAPGDGMH